MKLRIASADDGRAVADIYAPIVRDTAISFEDVAPSADDMSARINQALQTHPWLVLEIDGRVAAYAYATPHRSRAAYKWSCEVSVYVAPDARRCGAAKRLYERLFSTLRNLGYANAFAGVTLPNAASVGFHESLGFQPIGVFPRIGFKRGSWWDVGWWSLALQTLNDAPADPRAFLANQDAFEPR